MFPYFWNIIRLLFPFRYPMKLLTLIFGGILTSRCIWSGHTSPSIISTPFHWHNCRSISRISVRFSPKNTFLLYFGANTMWYLQFHVVYCLALPYDVLLVFFAWLAGPAFTLSHQESFLLSYRLSFSEPRHYGGVFLYNKKPALLPVLLFFSDPDRISPASFPAGSQRNRARSHQDRCGIQSHGRHS